MKRTIQALGLSAALVTALLLGGCASAGESGASSSESAAPTATPTATPQADPVPNPLTGVADADYTNRRPVAVTLRTLSGATPPLGAVRRRRAGGGRQRRHHRRYDGPVRQCRRHQQGRAGGPRAGSVFAVCPALNAVPVHIDKNVYASNLLNTLSYQDLDGYHIGKAAFAFDQDRQNAGYREENCWYTTGEMIRNGLSNYGTTLEGANTPLFVFGERPAVEEAARNGTSLTSPSRRMTANS